MQKGHLLVGVIVWMLMMVLPAISVTGEEAVPSPAVSTVEQAQGESAIRVLRTDTGAVETLPMHEYLFGVVAAEMPMTYHEQAIKAQVVAAHTLALYRQAQRAENPDSAVSGADVTDDSGTDQAYVTREVARAKWGDRADEWEAKLDGWIDEVGDRYIAYKDSPVMAVYHAVSAGRTESAENVWGGAVPYLVPVESVGDLTSEQYISEKTVSKADFIETLRGLTADGSPDLEAQTAVGEITRSESGTVLTAELFGQSFTGGDLRKAFFLRSANFDLAASGDAMVFTVRGYGHLVGMSQYGAHTMAQQGSTWQEILLWYYPGCTVAGN